MAELKNIEKVDNNRICHYCGAVIHNALSESSECYVDLHDLWYCSYEEYVEYRDVESFF